MLNKQSKIILHPVRGEIIQELIGGKKLSVSQIAKRISKVPHATLYRHINTLYEAGLLQVVEQKQVRGTIENIYSLSSGGESVSLEDLKKLTKEEHLNLFFQFLSGTINDFGTYLEKESFDLIQDGVGYRQASLYLDDNEFSQFTKELNEIFMKYYTNEPNDHRTKRKVTTIFIPDETDK